MILDVKNLHHFYGEVEALNNLNFSIKDSSIVSVLGPSGCGKTTLIRVIAGLESIQKGEISLEDNIVANSTLNTPPEKRPISYVFQDFALFPVSCGLHKVIINPFTLFRLVGLFEVHDVRFAFVHTN